jgi:heterodisulfide reductase subunit A
MENPIGTTLVMGAGVSGIRAALELAETGYTVLLTDSSPYIGGILNKLDYQFPTDHCGMCKMLPMVGREAASQYCMRKDLFHDNIRIMPFTEVTSIQGEPGAFTVQLTRHARYVDTEICDGTGQCIDACPVTVPDEFNHGLTARKAIYRPVPHNLPNMLVLDPAACTKCGACLEVCPVNAIDLEAQDETREMTVDTVVLSSGVGLFQPAAAEEMAGYTVSEDVVTALQFERMLSSTGSYAGVIKRPSDGRPAKRIAWVQCVGSRNRRHGRDYCSSICCMFALKEAVLAQKKGGPGMETTIFYMDMRTFEKDFHRYRVAAEEDHGVKLVRCRVQGVNTRPDGTLTLRSYDGETGEFQQGEFDLVVLSTGQSPPRVKEKLEELLRQPVGEGFNPSLNPDKVESPKDGVYMSGSFLGLTDISAAITSGLAAAGRASRRMQQLGRGRTRAELPAERNVELEAPKVAVVLCSWRDERLPAEIDLEPLKEALLKRNGVREVHILGTICRGEGQEQLARVLKDSTCNRLVLGACLPYVYRQGLRRLAAQAGFNPSLVEVMDLRGLIQRCLSEKAPEKLLERALRELQGTVDSLKLASALPSQHIAVAQSALVVGGGPAGMRAALSLAERGVPVHLVERGEQLGGPSVGKLHYTLEGWDVPGLLTSLREQVAESRHITVYLGAEVVTSDGSLGCYRTIVKTREGEHETLLHGALILATGGHEAPTTEYCYGQSESIVTQQQLEARLVNGSGGDLKSVVMIQCVGSREKGAREYCSRICCAGALKNALRIRQRHPEARVFVLNRDIMSYGAAEQFYSEARRQGVVFVNYDLSHKPHVEVEDGAVKVRFTDPVLRMEMEIQPSLLVLSTGIEPSAGNRKLASLFNVELDAFGFFKEAESKWRPVDLMRQGVFLAGVAHSPRPLTEALMQAEAAAQRAYTYLCQETINAARKVSNVRDSVCSRCLTCVSVCPYEARRYDAIEDRVVVDPTACQACGICAAACPNGAAEVLGLSEKQTLAVIDAALCGI